MLLYMSPRRSLSVRSLNSILSHAPLTCDGFIAVQAEFSSVLPIARFGIFLAVHADAKPRTYDMYIYLAIAFLSSLYLSLSLLSLVVPSTHAAAGGRTFRWATGHPSQQRGHQHSQGYGGLHAGRVHPCHEHQLHVALSADTGLQAGLGYFVWSHA